MARSVLVSVRVVRAAVSSASISASPRTDPIGLGGGESGTLKMSEGRLFRGMPPSSGKMLCNIED